MSCFLFPFPCWIWKEIASEDFFFHCGFASKRKRKHLLRFLSMVWPKEDPFHHALSATLRPMGKDALSTALATCFLRWLQPTARCIARLPKGRSKEAKHKNNSKSEAHSLFDNFRKFLTPIGPFLQTDIQHHPFLFGVIRPRRRRLPHSVLTRRLRKTRTKRSTKGETSRSGEKSAKSFSSQLYKVRISDSLMPCKP